MRNKLRNMVGRWADAGLVVEISLVNGLVLRGRVHEIDGDECILEPIEDDGAFGPLTVIQVAHVVTARYTDDAMPGEEEPEAAGLEDLPADEPDRF